MMRKSLIALLLVCFSTLVHADAGAQGPGVISNIVMVAGFLFIFYFMLIRPQSKRAKEHQNLISGIAKDDEVITSGGLLGKVLRVTDQFIVIAIAEGIEVKVQKQAISASIPKGTMKNI
ncbi:MAG: preprotein translocase subunit YajC [Gammaproteobacteria bacterium 39-13]|nr:MAG: preprotein translocase subunit YajC [Gammaproteobacteria bacterium 39-13]